MKVWNGAERHECFRISTPPTASICSNFRGKRALQQEALSCEILTGQLPHLRHACNYQAHNRMRTSGVPITFPLFSNKLILKSSKITIDSIIIVCISRIILECLKGTKT